jgi:hypothetical protein
MPCWAHQAPTPSTTHILKRFENEKLTMEPANREVLWTASEVATGGAWNLNGAVAPVPPLLFMGLLDCRLGAHASVFAFVTSLELVKPRCRGTIYHSFRVSLSRSFESNNRFVVVSPRIRTDCFESFCPVGMKRVETTATGKIEGKVCKTCAKCHLNGGKTCAKRRRGTCVETSVFGEAARVCLLHHSSCLTAMRSSSTTFKLVPGLILDGCWPVVGRMLARCRTDVQPRVHFRQGCCAYHRRVVQGPADLVDCCCHRR